MATRFDNTLQPSNSTNTLIRAWATFIEDTLVTTGGWVVTSDTGQTAPGSLTAPGALNTKVGYRIYRMNDSLQATAPVFMRIDFGSTGASNTPGIWVTLGTGSNGSGTITGICFDGGASTGPNFCGSANSATSGHNSYGSAAPNRASFALFVQSTQSRILTFTIERSKDATGADTGHGLILVGNNVGTGVNSCRYVIRAGGSQPADEGGVQFILSSQNPTTFATNVGVGLAIPMAGHALQPGYNFAITRTNDFATEASFSMSVYGSTVTYQILNSQVAFAGALATPAAVTNTRVAIRYD